MFIREETPISTSHVVPHLLFPKGRAGQSLDVFEFNSICRNVILTLNILSLYVAGKRSVLEMKS